MLIYKILNIFHEDCLILIFLSFLSMLHWNLNQPEQAVDYGEKASAKAGNQAMIPYNLGNMYYSLNRKQEAIGAFNRAIKVDPKMASGHINLGIVLSEEALYDEALHHLNIAITLNPNNPQAHSQIGMVYHVKGNLEDAKKQVILKIHFHSITKDINNWKQSFLRNEFILNHIKKP